MILIPSGESFPFILEVDELEWCQLSFPWGCYFGIKSHCLLYCTKATDFFTPKDCISMEYAATICWLVTIYSISCKNYQIDVSEIKQKWKAGGTLPANQSKQFQHRLSGGSNTWIAPSVLFRQFVGWFQRRGQGVVFF